MTQDAELETTKCAELDMELETIVIDNGSYQIKAGFADEDEPSCVFRSFVGKPSARGIATVRCTYAGDPQYNIPSESYIGVNHMPKYGPLECLHPISKGTFQEKDSMVTLLEHAFKRLGADSKEHAVLVTDTPLRTRRDQEIMCQVMFEAFNVPELFMADQAALSLYSVGATTGIVLQSGYEITRSVPVYEGYALPHATIERNFGGRDLTEFMMCLDWDASRHYIGPEDYLRAVRPCKRQQLFRDIKETVCYVADYGNCDEHSHSQRAKDHYTLPDGHELITFNCSHMKSRKSLRWQCPESLFQKGTGIAIDKMIVDSISKVDHDIRRDLYKNVVLSGGNTMFAGIEDRLKAELSQHTYCSVNVVADIKHYFGSKTYRPWVGGSVLASHSSFEDVCMTSDEYDDYGPSLAHRKFA